MRRALLALLAAGAVAGAVVAVAQERDDDPTVRPAARAALSSARALPPADAAIPRTPAPLAAALTDTTRRLRRAIGRWDAARAVPRDVTYLALYHQRMLRLMSARRAVGDATSARLAPDVRDDARATVLGRRHLAAIPRSPGRLPRVRVAPAAPAASLRAFYAEGERRFGVPWSILAAVNFVESAFGRVRSASEAGARGPMQFLPSTWRAYGMGGDIDDPHDAVLAAANLLRRAGAPRDLDRALFAYNHSTHYVRAIRLFAARMAADERTFLTYYAWQVYVRTPAGVRRLTGPPGERRAAAYGRTVPEAFEDGRDEDQRGALAGPDARAGRWSGRRAIPVVERPSLRLGHDDRDLRCSVALGARRRPAVPGAPRRSDTRRTLFRRKP